VICECSWWDFPGVRQLYPNCGEHAPVQEVQGADLLKMSIESYGPRSSGVTVVTSDCCFFWYTKFTYELRFARDAVVRILRLDSSPPFLPAVYLREIQNEM
jgi:hypothetical protein